MSWTIFSSAFLTAGVEWVEAYTIVLAVSLTIGWRAALGAVAAASATLVGLTAATGGVLALGAGIRWIQPIGLPCRCSGCAGWRSHRSRGGADRSA
jgi:uncharacterized membrane protein